MNNMWKEAVAIWLKAITWHFPGEREEALQGYPACTPTLKTGLAEYEAIGEACEMTADSRGSRTFTTGKYFVWGSSELLREPYYRVVTENEIR